MARKLSVVTDETAPAAPKRPTSIKAAAEMSERDLLVAMRDAAASVIDAGGVPAHALGGLMRQIRDFDRDIRTLDLRAAEEKKESEEAEVEDGRFDASAV